MSKKKYILATLLTSLLFLAILPLINYTNDQWRVLHKDYAFAYEDFPPTHKSIAINMNYLKTTYILDNPYKYDTLLFGSSRNAAFVETDISSKAYNAWASFATINHNLHTLKVLLKHAILPKEIWIGINDFDIWKNPKDFENDYARRSYQEDLKEKFNFFKLYLFKKIDNNDIKIFKGKYRLTLSNRIYRENLNKKHKPLLIQKENSLIAMGEKWKKKLNSTAAALLGYKDKPNSYRIDKTIQEIKEIKELCDKNHIKVNFFFYPEFYKTYIMYNQYKIEEFKKQLVQVTNFYDFYKLDETAFNEFKWRDTSHFVYSVGLDLIKSIKTDTNLVTKENYKKVFKDERAQIARLLDKELPIPYIVRFNGNIPLENMHTIYTLKDRNYTPNTQTKVTQSKEGLKIISLGNDPYILFKPLKAASTNVILHCEIESKEKTLFQIYYKKAKNGKFNEHNSARIILYKGLNNINLLIPSQFLQYGFRIDPAQTKGKYLIKKLEIFSH